MGRYELAGSGIESRWGRNLLHSSLPALERTQTSVYWLLNYLLTYLLTHLLTYLLTYILTYLFTYLLTYLLAYLLHGAESFLRS